MSERPSLVRRVALTSAIAAAVGGATAATFAGVLANRLVTRHEDQTVLAAVRELADEIDEELERGGGDDEDDDDDIQQDADGRPILSSVLAHELEDVKLPDASAAIVRQRDTVVGDASLPAIAAGECTAVDTLGLGRRVCAASLAGSDLVVLGVSTHVERERWALLAWALVGGALVGAVVGGAASLRSARWALAPLTELRDRVRRVDGDAPRSEILDPPARHAELEELRGAIAQLVDRLGASLVHAQSFSAEAAHELRTPLALLAGELELMIENQPDAASPERRALVRLHQLVRGLIALVQRLLVLAGPGRIPVEHAEVIDLADVVELVHDGLPLELVARLHTRVDDDVIVRGDPGLLRALLSNAIENAMKFSADVVDVRVAAVGSDAVIDVIDSGPGIPPADRAKVFAPFYRSAAARSGKTSGHGVGLALIAHVAAAHGGTAQFVDTTSGAHLRIVLPRTT